MDSFQLEKMIKITDKDERAHPRQVEETRTDLFFLATSPHRFAFSCYKLARLVILVYVCDLQASWGFRGFGCVD